MKKRYTYEARAKKVGRTIGENKAVTEICVWTDGLSLCADNKPPYCAFKLEDGKKYRVTVEEIN